MILDTSAVIAILWREAGWEALVGKLEARSSRGIGTPTLAELGVVLSWRLTNSPIALVARFIQEFDVAEVPFGPHHWQEAVTAYGRFGKGRHRARLNFGDCMTYAVAKVADLPLLFVGDDFGHTDITAA